MSSVLVRRRAGRVGVSRRLHGIVRARRGGRGRGRIERRGVLVVVIVARDLVTVALATVVVMTLRALVSLLSQHLGRYPGRMLEDQAAPVRRRRDQRRQP